MRFTTVFTAFLAASIAVAAPMTSHSRAPAKAIETRQDGDLVDIVTEILDNTSSEVQNLGGNPNAEETIWTQNSVEALQSAYPNSNILIFHDQGSDVSGLVNAQHVHYELSIFEGIATDGFEIYIFDSGSFTLVGDGGFANWAFSGNWQRNGDTVVFSDN